MNSVERYMSVIQEQHKSYKCPRDYSSQSPPTEQDYEDWRYQNEIFALKMAELQVMANISTLERLAAYLVDNDQFIRKLAEIRYKEIEVELHNEIRE